MAIKQAKKPNRCMAMAVVVAAEGNQWKT